MHVLKITFKQKEFLEKKLGKRLAHLGFFWNPIHKDWSTNDFELYARIKSILKDFPKSIKKCKQCGNPGHNTRTCNFNEQKLEERFKEIFSDYGPEDLQ